MKVVGYTRVSTDEQVDSGAGLEAQERAIRAEATHRGWELVLPIYREGGASAKSLAGRPQLAAALKALDSKQADALVVAKQDRLSRSLSDFVSLMSRSQRRGWSVIALDQGVDTTTPAGKMMAGVLAVFAEFERDLIGQRTHDAIAVKKSQGKKFGRFKGTPARVRTRITRMHAAGTSLSAIARRLNEEGVPTAQGAQRSAQRVPDRRPTRWHASTVRVVLARPSTSPSKQAPEPRDGARTQRRRQSVSRTPERASGQIRISRALPPGIAITRARQPTGEWMLTWSPGLSKREAEAARIAAVALDGPVVMTVNQLFAIMAAAA